MRLLPLILLPLGLTLSIPYEGTQRALVDAQLDHNDSEAEEFTPDNNITTITSFTTTRDLSIAPSTFDYDAIVVGGGPAGLSALSALARVGRKAVLYDSQEYRNLPTRYMHDVIGNDGTPPNKFRALARTQIEEYPTVSFEKRGRAVTAVFPIIGGFRVTDSDQGSYTAKRVILATGLKDVLPNTPGIAENWGKGIFWCAWCDGYEHRGQQIGVLSRLSQVVGSVLTLRTLSQKVIAFVNGTDTAEEKAKLSLAYPNWQAQLTQYGVVIDNRLIKSIERVGPVGEPGTDKFKVNYQTGGFTEGIGAFITNFGVDQTSSLPAQLHLEMTTDKKIKVNPNNMETSTRGVYAVGDANSDGSTNVPHAMWSGKRAAVSIHATLAREESLKSIGQEVSVMETVADLGETVSPELGYGLEMLWERAQLA